MSDIDVACKAIDDAVARIAELEENVTQEQVHRDLDSKRNSRILLRVRRLIETSWYSEAIQVIDSALKKSMIHVSEVAEWPQGLDQFSKRCEPGCSAHGPHPGDCWKENP